MTTRTSSAKVIDDDLFDGGYIRCTSRYNGRNSHWSFIRFGFRGEIEKGHATLEEIRDSTADANLKGVCQRMIDSGATLEELIAYDTQHLPECAACITIRTRHGEKGLPPIPVDEIRPEARFPRTPVLGCGFGTREHIIRDIAGF